MKVRQRFFNRSEELVFRELTSIAEDNSLVLFAKTRVSDVLEKTRPLLPSEFSMFSSAHFDFLLTNREHAPVLAVEYDGPSHLTDAQLKRDAIKNAFCSESGLPLIRIGANYITKQFRGMTLLRWIVEVMELEKAFEEARGNGQIPLDEDFDPMMIASAGTRRWPYWLSVDETIRINKFTRGQNAATRSWGSIHGVNDEKNTLWLEYIKTDDGILCTRCKFRNQQAPFPFWEMMEEVGRFEMGRKLLAYEEGKARLVTYERFVEVIKNLNVEYNFREGHYSGKTDDRGLLKSLNL